ncbi:hypothetical protein NE237_014593 [Protea cynaroides]|uniref:Peptidase A1 domain-containing protein n=1 Tax=Protea cynaroides TaxID=273540 RepID=A0A9Q0KCD8_9MAGN|nr:hypothetical protein NE237_014593 [Protea cynaroides]
MASSLCFLLFSSLLLLLLLTSLSDAKSNDNFHPNGLVLPVSKDASTLQYLTSINQRTPLIPVNVVVDLGGQSLWVDCEKGYNSSSYHHARCQSSQCYTTCSVIIHNNITHTATIGKLGKDVVSIQSTNGSNPGGDNVLIPHRISLPAQFAANFNFEKKFAICLWPPTSTSYKGRRQFESDKPYKFLPDFYASSYLIYTEFYKSPVSSASSEYFIGVKSIKVNERTAMVEPISPYTVMESSIYKAVTQAFIKGAESRNNTRVDAVSPSGTCFSTKNMVSTRGGYGVPIIDLVLQNETVSWSIFGVNSMVQMSNDVVCLGFLDGGSKPKTSISELGFSSSLSFFRTACADFNFTSSV